ncbi:MAG TPA: DUF4175 family protein [Longimicrobiales bacterium]
MTPSMIPLGRLLDDVRRTLRRETALAVVLSSLCAIPGALLAAWVIGLLRPWGSTGFGPLLLDALAVGAGGVLVYVGVRRWINALDEHAVAADAERAAGVPEGTVRGALELARSVPDGTSAALARRAEAEVTRRISAIAPTAVTPVLRGRARQRRRVATGAFFALSIMTVLLAFAAPDHSRAAWSPMARPVRHLVPPPLPPLVVTPGDVEVQRGTDLAVRIEAPGREAVTLHWRKQGDVPRQEVGAVIADSAVITIPGIDAAAEYWVRAPDGATSARFRITPADPLLLADLAIDVIYPAHAGRASEHFQGEVPPLEIPEGTQLVIRGRATRALAQAALVPAQADVRIDFVIADDGFRGTLTPAASGVFAWHLRDVTGGDIAVQPAPLDITVVPDAAPQVEITFPATDTVLDASLRQAVVADARDDFGLVRADLVSWRVGRSGERAADVEQPISLTGDDRALIRTLLDASARDLVPGDTLKFYIRVSDSSPRRQTSVSRTVSLRLPGMVELREESSDRADALVDDAEQLAGRAAEIQKATRELERRTAAANARRQAERQRGTRSGADGRQRMDYEEAAAPRQLLQQQEELVAQMEAMREQLEAFERAMERAGLRDAELQQRLEEMRELYDQMMTPEMREQLEQLRSALEQLDPEAVQKALEEMAAHQDEMKEQLDRTLELMRRAAAEQQMNNLAQEARELATQQQALAESMSQQPPTPEQAKAQQDLAKRTEELAQALEQMQEKLREQGEPQTAESTQQAQRNAAQAGEQMEQAAQDASRRDGRQAAEKGEQAAERLEQAAEMLDQARTTMAEEWKQGAQQSMEQATRDALDLAERQQQLTERMKQAAEQQGAQGQKPPQPGQQQSGQQQQGGQQQGGQQQGGQQQGGQQQGGQQQGGQQQGGQQQGGQQPGGQQPGGQQAGGGSGGDVQSMQTEQSALQQGLQQLGRNVQESGERDGAVNREVGSALGRANLSMQQTLDQMQRGELPTDQAQQTVDALNRLALALLNNAQSMNNGEGGEGSEALQQMADIAKQQGNLNGRSNALSPMNVTQSAMNQQLNRLAADQMEIARRLGELNRGGQDGLTGDIDALAREAEQIARQLESGRLPPGTLARQERLFHRMLDAGRSLEKDEFEDERTAERPTDVERRTVQELDAALFRDPTRFRAPTPEELQALPPAYRRLILDYFERLNRPEARQQERPPGG